MDESIHLYASKQVIRAIRQAANSHIKITRVNFDADAISAPPGGSHAGGSAAQKGVKDCVTNKAEHSYQSFREFQREGRRVIFG